MSRSLSRCGAALPPLLHLSHKHIQGGSHTYPGHKHPQGTNIPRAGQLDVLGSDGDTLGVDGTLVGVLEQANQVGLTDFLEGHGSISLEPQVSLEVLGDLTD